MKSYAKAVVLPRKDADKVQGWLEEEGLFVKPRPSYPDPPPTVNRIKPLFELICDNFNGEAQINVSPSTHYSDYVLVATGRCQLDVAKEVFDEELIDQIDECLRAHGGFDPPLLRSLHEQQ